MLVIRSNNFTIVFILGMLIAIASHNLFRLLPKDYRDYPTIIGMVIGGVSLIATIADSTAKAELERQKRIAELRQDFLASINKMQTSFAEKDYQHEQEISRLLQEMSAFKASIEIHFDSFGHQRLIEQMILSKQDLAKVQASVELLTNHRYISQLVLELKDEVENLRAIVQSVDGVDKG